MQMPHGWPASRAREAAFRTLLLWQRFLFKADVLSINETHTALRLPALIQLASGCSTICASRSSAWS
jgi:hypothetical protein